MTKKTEDKDLQEMQDILQELEENQEEENSSSKQDDTTSDLKAEINRLSLLLAEKEEIAKKAQIEYINLKSDFDFLVRQTKLKEESLEQDVLIKTVKKLLPFVEDLRKSLHNLSNEQKAEPL